MTCIVGFVKDGITYIGGDSLGSNGYSGTVNKNRKVFHSKDTDKAIIGYTSTFRMGQLLQYSKGLFDELSINKDNINDEYMITNFIPRLQNLFNNGGIEQNNNGVKSSGEFLLGYKDKLYKVQSDYSILESVDNYDACGCGEDFALGSLKTTENMNLKPEEKIHLALQSASKFSVGVAPPFYIINTKDDTVLEFVD